MGKGIDVAQMDLNGGTIDPVALKNSGVTFAVLRKSHCYRDRSGRFVLAIDPTYATYAQALRDVGIRVGGYVLPRFDLGAPSVADQFTNFEKAGPPRQPGDLPDFLDVELTGNGLPDTKRKAVDVANDVYAFTKLLGSQGRRAGVYTSHVQTHDSNGLQGMLPVAIGAFFLWQKIPYHLTAGMPLDTSKTIQPHFGHESWDPHDYYRVPAPWLDRGWWMLQKQGDERGTINGVYQCDVNEWNYLSKSNGASGADPRVKEVQQQLGAAGYEIKLTGVWDQLTEDAVRRVQDEHHLEDDAVIGPATHGAIFP